jgi:alpha-tubulin suppressor-like RCC1 family protein
MARISAELKGMGYTLILKQNSLWGYNNLGQLGDGTVTSKSLPVSTLGSFSWTSLDTERGGIGLLNNGTVWTWGSNTSGELGIYTDTSNRSSPVQVAGGYSFASIYGSQGRNYALQANGSLWAWGAGVWGILGVGDENNRSSPTLVIGGHSFINLDSASSHVLALKADGSAWSWGRNDYGQLGLNSISNRSSPTQVIGGHSFIEVSCGWNASYGLKYNGEIWAWGRNGHSQLGDTGANRSSPVKVTTSHRFVRISGSLHEGTLLALKADGSVWGCGRNTDAGNLLGIAYPAIASSMVLVTNSHSFIDIKVGSAHALALKADGSVWTWGTNTYGQLGNGTTTDIYSPIKVSGFNSFNRISAGVSISSAIDSINPTPPLLPEPIPDPLTPEFYAWGSNSWGEIGNQTTTDQSIPRLVVGSHAFTSIAAGQKTVGLKADGSAWAWGAGANGLLGLYTDTANRSSPTQVAGNHSFVTIASKADATFGLKANGEVWSWGADTLGIGAAGSRSSPTLVIGGHSFIKISASVNHVLALKANGQVWGWGQGTSGELGNSNLSTYSSPVLVNTFTSVRELVAGWNMSLVIDGDGNVQTWGDNTYNMLGNGTVGFDGTPNYIDLDQNFSKVVAANNFIAGLDGSGQVWAWGTNYTLVVDYLSTKISGSHSFVKVVADVDGTHLAALKANGEVWVWGEDLTSGLLYGPSTPPLFGLSSLPVLVNAGHSMSDIFTGGVIMFAKKTL